MTGNRSKRSNGRSARGVLGRWPRKAALAVLAAAAPFGSAAAQVPGYGPGMPGMPGMPAMAPRAVPARTVALSSPEKRPLPPQVARLPEVQEELEVIHHRSQLVVGRDRIVRTAIADGSVIQVVQYSENEIDVIGLETGSTTLTIWFEKDPEPLIYLVTVIRDPSLEEQKRIDYGKLERKLRVLFPNSQVYLIPLSYKIIVKGQARDPEEASKILDVVRGEVINQNGSLPGPQPGMQGLAPGLATNNGGDAGFGALGGYDVASSYIVNMLQVPGERQVMIHVRIAELNREQLRRMGVDLSWVINGGRHVIGSFAGGLPSTFTGILENGEVGVLVNWLASNGTGKILSEPSLAVLSGHPASFLAGGEFAVPTIVGVNGVGGQQTTFRGFGTSLIVTPTVIDKDLIRLRIVPEYSEIDDTATVSGIPGLSSRRVQTTVELREGQTFALAGLVGRRTQSEVTRIPFLGDLPLVGPRLFAGKRASEDETELLILVTPELVRPMDADEVPPVPGYYVTHPDDCQLYFHGMTEGPPDLGVYQVGPIGRNATYGREVGYRAFEPGPATPLYSPSVPYPNGNVAPMQVPPTTGRQGGMPMGGMGMGMGGMGGGYSEPPLPPGAYPSGGTVGLGSYPPVAPPAESMPRNFGPTPAGPVPALPGPSFEGPTGQRTLGERLRSVLPAGFQADAEQARSAGQPAYPASSAYPANYRGR